MRSLSMQSLTDAIKRRHPGVVVYGIGDPAHKLRRSSHNEDDTPGSLPEQEDADSNPEHRAIDVMLGPSFTRNDAYDLIADLLADPAALARLVYILFNGWRWSRNTGWERVEFDGDPHDDHIHFTGDADDDENAAPWPAVDGGDMFCKKGDRGENVRRLQLLLNEVTAGRPDLKPLVVDGGYGDTTAARVYLLLSGPKDGANFNGTLAARLDRALFVAWLQRSIADGTIPVGRDGEDGEDGTDGKDAVLAPGTVLVVQEMPGGAA